MKILRNVCVILFAVLVIFPFTIAPVKADAAPKLNKSKINMSTADTFKLKVLNTNQKVTWSSSNSKVAKISQKGTITPITQGTVEISAKMAETTLTCKVKVLPEEVWAADYSRFLISVMPLSKTKSQVEVCVINPQNTRTFLSGPMNAVYSKEEKVYTFIEQGKYNLTGGYTTITEDGTTYLVLVVMGADKNIFLTDSTILNIKIETT